VSDPAPRSLTGRTLLEDGARAALMRLADEHAQAECTHGCNNRASAAPPTDVRLALSSQQLTEAIGAGAVSRLVACFGRAPDAIRLRRVEAGAGGGGGGGGECVAFHTDYSLRTMQVALNACGRDYTGGQLVWAVRSAGDREYRLELPVRHAGEATMHTRGVVHGVTVMTSGVRYGLFFCELPPSPSAEAVGSSVDLASANALAHIEMGYLVSEVLLHVTFLKQAGIVARPTV
jgi:hypothetical protein